MGKSTPRAPTPPDPMATAQAQGQINQETAITQAGLNRIDQVTPQGSLTYSSNGTWEDGTPRYTQTQSYSPGQQALYDQQMQIATALNGLAGGNIDRVAQVQSQPFSYDGMTPMQSGVGQGLSPLQMSPNSPNLQTSFTGGGPVQTSFNNGGPVQNGFDPGQNVQGSFNGGGPMQNGFDPGQNVQGQVNFGDLGSSIPGYNDYGGEGQRTSNAMYQQAQSRLDPQFQQRQHQLSARLANSGIPVGSQAWQREMDQLGRERTDAYQQANWSSIGAGSQEQSRLFDLAMRARQQGTGEQVQQGQFANAAAAQQYAQNMGQGQFWNQAQQQQYAQNMGQGQFANAAAAQQYGQNQGMAQFWNTAQNQGFNQNLAGAQFGNQAQDQQFQQGMAGAEFGNQARGQQYAMDQQGAAFNNQAQNQGFNQQIANANLNNASRQQQISEATYLRNLPLNEIAALLGTGGGVSNPQFQNFAQVGVAAPDYQNAVYNNYNAAMQQYNQAQANRSQGLGSIFGTLGSLGSAAIMASDRRLKYDLRHVGQLANGIKTYTFKYLGTLVPCFGVMAQEVRDVLPDAVGETPSGFLYVDYGKVFA